ncbi:hypothetical protein FH972_012207 [Carpinus fangiana]|uniref:ARID domain-containing protein n=1 Tax=Carpinus fangiana TaxID=176857 RepID=A0A5N6R357_9ROSI|nr:hypothetical protein FH972_012207 [Carpinus fangiana]
MAGCSILTNGSALDCVEIASAYQNNGSSVASDNSVEDVAVVGVHDSHDDYKVKLRGLFDQVLSVFLKEITSKGVIRPVPAVLGDGRSLDLFRLFWVVRKRGGFDMVSKKGLWAYVADDLGLDLRTTPSVKLICFKYLNELEKWFKERCRDRKLGNGQYGCDGGIGLLSLEVETEFRGLLSHGLSKKKNDDGFIRLESCKSGEYTDMDVGKRGFHFSDTKIACRIRDDVGKVCRDDDKNNFKDVGADHEILDSKIAKEEFNFRKRKRESVAGVLKWVIQIAKNPADPSVGVIPEPSKWNEHEGKDLWAQVVRAREAMLLRRHVIHKTEGSLLEKKLKMHPSMYEDSSAPCHHQSTARVRCSQRLPTLGKCRASCCNSRSATQLKLSPHQIELDNGPKEQELVTVDISATDTTVNPPEDDYLPRQVYGDCLAEIPEWTGVVSESDSKWLGTCIWPLEHEKHIVLIETDPIGRGRPDLCGCRLPGSVECVRFHIAEKRMKLKLELGSVFYRWGFDHMGEEVSLQWTSDEETRVKDMVRSNLWKNAFKCFPRKTRENLVSYYFNVFLVLRRRYQNRVTPNNIDSDDDESDFGSLGDGFGHEAVKIPGFNFLEKRKEER